MGLPPGFVPATTYSAQPGAAVRPNQQQFWNSQAPVGRREFRPAAQILRAGNFAILNRYAPPAMGDRGPTPPVRGRCREATEGIGWRSYGHEVPVGRVPRRSFGDFPIGTLGKSLAARRQRNPPATNATIPSSPPHPSRLRRATFPPGGRLKGSRRRNSPPLRKPAPPCFKRKTLLQYGGRNPNREGERPWSSTAWWPRPRAPSPTAW